MSANADESAGLTFVREESAGAADQAPAAVGSTTTMRRLLSARIVMRVHFASRAGVVEA